VERRFEDWDEDLTLIKTANRDLSMAELHLRQRVWVAHRHGHSWAAIGFVLGISTQEARRRFGMPGEQSA
jgi:hypothetical protein